LEGFNLSISEWKEHGDKHLQEYHIFPSKTCSFATSKKILGGKKRAISRVSNNPLLKYRR
jgi:hypothetical protein